MKNQPGNSWPNGWLVIINPNAGKRRGRKDWHIIESLLKEAGFRFDAVFTGEKGEALSLAGEHLKAGISKIIMVGGDGTANEVVNGIFHQEKIPVENIVLGMIPVGTGNDWGRMYRIPGNYKKAVEVLREGITFRQDVGYVTYKNQGGADDKRYFANSAGIGYDALVARKTNKLKESGKGGLLSYLSQLVSGLIKYKYNEIRLEIDGKVVFEGPFFTLSLGHCCYNGGGMKQLPYAIPDDGLFDVSVIKAVKKRIIFRNIPRVYDGSHVKLPFVNTHRGSEILLTGLSGPIPDLETDGESLGQGPFRFSVIPKSLNVIVNKDWSRE